MTIVAITGSTGVVGRALLNLLTDRGFDVRALIRTDSDAGIVAGLGATPVPGDLLDPESLALLVADCEFVFNVAGINEMCVRDAARMEQVNVTGVRNVIDACRRSGVRRLIHTSSAVTLGEERGSVGNEDSPHRGWFLSEYERTKTVGEEVLFKEAGDLEVVAVNPSSVQGPGRVTGTGKIILDVVNGDMSVLVDSAISLVDIDDCARGHLLAATNGAAGSRYVLNGAVLSVREAVQLAATAAGRPISPRYLPVPVVSTLASVAEPLGRLFRRDLPFCKESIRVMTFGHRYDGSRATGELGLDYRPIEDTIKRTIEWFEVEGYLN